MTRLFHSKVLKHSRLILIITGFWPDDNKINPNNCFLKSSLTGISAVCATFFQSLFMFLNYSGESVEKFLAECLDGLGTFFLCVKAASFVFSRKRVIKLIKETERFMSIRKSPTDCEIMKIWHSRYAKISKYVSRFYLLILVISLIGPIELKSLPLSAQHPLFFYKIPWYIMIYFTEMILCTLSVFGTITSNIITTFFISNLCGELECIAEKMNQFDNQRETIHMRKIVVKHVEVLHYGNKICQLVSEMYYMQHICSIIAVCFSGFAALKSTNIITTVRAIGIASLMISEVFIACFNGEAITHSSVKIGDAISSSNWYKSSKKDCKNFQLVLLRSQKPLQLRMGTILMINFKAFAKFASGTYSCLTILNSIITR